ncbi:hypothetical protein [Streptomyces sp. W1SF4]|uniref:hypothetical protein n=1 Tax=Streptomyces sp. W1SF4 TaxID=2305220 RepID=UPI0013DE878F|nr:hypothetical protein [Streptomyces sp. W1SF4]
MRLTMHRHAVSPRRDAGRLSNPVRRSALLLAAAALPAALVVPLASPAEAAPVTVTFNPGANQPFNVPSGVTRLTITATGAAGANGANGGAGGDGAVVTGSVDVPSGTTTLYVNVATGGGTSGTPGGSGEGGGASDVRTCDSTLPGCVLTGVPATDPRLIVAGGGGGGGSTTATAPFPLPEATGGDAGTTGQTGGNRPNGGRGGGGGTQTTPGAGGAACPSQTGGTPGTSGGAGTGGDGGDPIPGGGGGAGWFGGGGGGGCDTVTSNDFGTGGGGGGSNRVPAGGTSGLATGPASVTITYEQGGNGGVGGPILPVNLSGVIPMFNNISTNNNINSPGARNATTQNFGLSAP